MQDIYYVFLYPNLEKLHTPIHILAWVATLIYVYVPLGCLCIYTRACNMCATENISFF